MKFNQALENLDSATAIRFAKTKADNLGISWDNGINYIFNACLMNLDLAPQIGTTKDTQQEVIEKWVKKYHDGYENRISARVSRQTNTIPDQMVYVIIEVMLNHLAKEDIDKIKYGHNLAMAAENILGHLLEEYLSIELEPHNWGILKKSQR